MPSTFKRDLEIFIEKIFKEVKRYYGDRLISFVLFGSQARGTQRPDSDIDLLLVIKDLPKSRLKRSEEFTTKIENKLEKELERLYSKGIYTWINAILKTPEEIEKGSLLLLDMIEDAKILYDKEDFFKKRLERLKKRLEKWGAKRVWKGNAWYWILKPDLKPGERIEI
ncbi:MAG: nucleotidyltransferase domain-containing protein [Caldimicrobium sp.]